ncbi:MAG: hypothetical protein ACRC6O_11265 [Flavobacterium sp.]
MDILSLQFKIKIDKSYHRSDLKYPESVFNELEGLNDKMIADFRYLIFVLVNKKIAYFSKVHKSAIINRYSKINNQTIDFVLPHDSKLKADYLLLKRFWKQKVLALRVARGIGANYRSSADSPTALAQGAE